MMNVSIHARERSSLVLSPATNTYPYHPIRSDSYSAPTMPSVLGVGLLPYSFVCLSMLVQTPAMRPCLSLPVPISPPPASLVYAPFFPFSPACYQDQTATLSLEA